MKGLIVTNGFPVNRELLMREMAKADLVLCVDGAFRNFDRKTGHPDLLLGDFDSIEADVSELVEKDEIQLIRFAKEKDQTDTGLAVDYMIYEKMKEVTILGAIGSRMDHTLANVMLLRRLRLAGIWASIADEKNQLFYLMQESFCIEEGISSFVSFIPFSVSSEVSLHGFKYPLSHREVPFGSTLGISNEILLKEALVEVHRGEILLFLTKD